MGMLLRPLDAALSSQSKIRLLRALLPLEDAVSAREAARLAVVPLPPALRALKDLVALGVLRRVELTSQHLYTVNREEALVQAGLEPLFAAEQKRVRSVFEWLREGLANELSSGALLTLAVYGSAARGEDRPDSDFDVLAVTQGEAVSAVHDRLAKLGPELEKKFGLDISPLVVSTEQFHHQLVTGDSVAASIQHEGRVVAGLPFDRLLAIHVER
jgi:predicted nucleotidyltransferase